MSQVVRLVHISDLHARVSQKEQITLRVNAFLNDLAKLNQPIDAILFTGDLAFSGKPEEYELAERLLLTPLKRRFKIPKEKMFFIPGNHDVDRDCIDPFTEDGITRRLNTVEDAEAILEHPQHSLKRLENYSNFIQGFLKRRPRDLSGQEIECRWPDVRVCLPELGVAVFGIVRCRTPVPHRQASFAGP